MFIFFSISMNICYVKIFWDSEYFIIKIFIHELSDFFYWKDHDCRCNCKYWIKHSHENIQTLQKVYKLKKISNFRKIQKYWRFFKEKRNYILLRLWNSLKYGLKYNICSRKEFFFFFVIFHQIVNTFCLEKLHKKYLSKGEEVVWMTTE